MTITIETIVPFELDDFINYDSDTAIELAFDAWLDSPDGRRWDRSDFTNSDACEDARFHFEAWFEEWVIDLPDPEELHAHGLSDYRWMRLAEQGTEFFELVYDHLHGLR